MDGISTFWLGVILIVLIMISAFFAGSETAMMATSRHRLKMRGGAGAKRSLRLLDNIEHLIGAILIGNNFVNILAASITTILAIRLWGDGSVVYASLLLTVVILIFAETTPKTFAAKNPEKVAIPSSIIIVFLIKLFKPFVWFIGTISKRILKMLGVVDTSFGGKITTEELRMMVQEAKPGVAANDWKMLLNIIDLQKMKVEDIMIPRSELVGIDIQDWEAVVAQLAHIEHTRLLVFEGSLRNIVGILHMRDVANLFAADNFSEENLRAQIREAYFISEGTNIARQLSHFQKHKRRLGLVVDEYGEVKGLVVLEDILEEIVGQFTSNRSERIEEIKIQPDGSYLVNPKVSIREVEHALDIRLKSKSKTLNGYILENLQAIPEGGVSVKIGKLLIEIVRLNEQTIKLVRLTKIDRA